MKKSVWITLAALLALGFSGRWLIWGKAQAAEAGPGPADSTRCRVERGPLRIVVEENGYLAAKDNVKISPKFKGQGTIAVLVEEGKSVVPGDVLVEFDKTQLETQISELENSLVQYEIELEAAKANLEIQERDNQAVIEKAELTLEFARLTLERYEQGDAPNELRKLALAAEKSASELERAKERFQQVPELVAQGFLTRIQEEEERIRLREAEINDENARKDLELHQAYTTRMERTKKETEVKDAQRELENARKKAGINLKEKQAALAQRERQVSSTKNRLEQQRTELGHYTVKAENPGIVHYGDPENPWWRQETKVGNSAYQGQTLITIPDLSSMQVLLQIHEADIDKVKVDLPVTVTVDARKGESFTGKITEIASVATSNNWSDETNKSFKVEVTLDAFPGELRAGVTAKAEIAIETLPDVLYVPIHAIVPEGGKHLAFVIQGARTEEREVQIGRNNARTVQVLAGLAEGDELLLYDPREEGDASRAAAPGGQKNGAQKNDDDQPLPGAPVAE
jgi:RND family efflux transporter MFP subunit